MKYYKLGWNVIIWSYCYHREQMLSFGANIIMWDEMLSWANVIIWRKCHHLELMLSSGTKCCHELMLSSGANVIIWSWCYHPERNVVMLRKQMLSSGQFCVVKFQQKFNVIICCYHLVLLCGVIMWYSSLAW